MARKNDIRHPYMRGYNFWLPILSSWIQSNSYTEKAKEEFRASLEIMEKEKNLKVGEL